MLYRKMPAYPCVKSLKKKKKTQELLETNEFLGGSSDGERETGVE